MTDSVIDSCLEERFGWISLDFVNTCVVTRSGPVDALRSPALLFQWMEHAEPPGWTSLKPADISAQRTLHIEALNLRVVLDQLFTAHVAGHNPKTTTEHALGRPISWTLASSRLGHSERGTLLIENQYAPLHAAAALGPIAQNAVELIQSVDPARLRRCAAHLCLRSFVDTSKGGRRGWCSMATCGNRAKAARYRARQERDTAEA